MLSPDTVKDFFLARPLAVATLLCGMLFSPVLLAQQNPEDPWEPVNRTLYAFNDTIDDAAIKPFAKGYQKFVPLFVRSGVSNFFSNVGEVNVIVNDVLQLKMGAAANDTGRFLLNSTVGLAGLIDVASGVGLEKHEEDFGQTLGYWGVGPGPYVVLPFLGTSTVRDTIGMVPDTLLNPIFWLEDSKTSQVLYMLELTDTRVYYLMADDLMQGRDEYSYVREALLQRREYLVNDGIVRDETDEFDF